MVWITRKTTGTWAMCAFWGKVYAPKIARMSFINKKGETGSVVTELGNRNRTT